MAHIHAIELDNGTSYLIEPRLYAVGTGTNIAVTAFLEDFALISGAYVFLRVQQDLESGATLNVSSTGAKAIYYDGSPLIGGTIKTNHIYTLLYDGTYWQLIGDNTDFTWDNIEDKPESFAPATHTHGNITNDGELGNNTGLVATLDGTIVVGPRFGNNQNQYLNNLGEWATLTIDYPVTSVNGMTGDVTINASNLGINPMHFIGQATVLVVEGTTTDPQISGYNVLTDRVAGDVILGYNDGREYVWSEAGQWELLGQNASTTLDSDDLIPDSTIDDNIFIAQIEQFSDRIISVKRAALDTSGTWTGTASFAARFLTPQRVYVDLETTSTTTTITGDSDTAEILGINGVLPISHGGTGTNTFPPNHVILSEDDSGGVTALVSRAYSDSTQPDALLSNSSNFVTERDVYYALPAINGLHNYTSNTFIYAPEVAGNRYQILVSGTRSVNNDSVYSPQWAPATELRGNVSSSATLAETTLILGNNIASTAVGNSMGKITLFSSSTGSHTIYGDTGTTDVTHIFEDVSGYVVQSVSGGRVGSNVQPIYINNNGLATALTYVPNRLYFSDAAPVGESAATDFIASSHYANSTQIAINSTSIPAGNETLYVNGKTTITGILSVTDTTEAAPATPAGALLVSGGAIIAKNTHIGGSTSITANLDVGGYGIINGPVGIGMDYDTSVLHPHILRINGSTIIFSDTTAMVHLDVPIVNDNSSILGFYPEPPQGYSGLGYVGLSSNRWDSGYFSNIFEVGTYNSNDELIGININHTGIINIQNTNRSSILLDTTAEINNIWETELTLTTRGTSSNHASISLYTAQTTSPIGEITISATEPTILLDTLTGANSDWIITNASGIFSLNNQHVQAGQTLIELQGKDDGFKLTNRLYINQDIQPFPMNQYILYVGGGNSYFDGSLIPSINIEDTNNPYPDKSLGTSQNHWSSLYVGPSDTYGDPYLPIYWNDGIPTPCQGIVQYKEFTIPSGGATTTLYSPAYNQLYGYHTFVLAIIVTDGEEYLSSPINWLSAQGGTGYGSITLYTTANVTGNVYGYILTARGVEAPNIANSGGNSGGNEEPSGEP